MSAIATLLTNEAYLPGALTLAHTLRALGTEHTLVVLVDDARLSARSVLLVEAAYDRMVSISDRIVHAPTQPVVHHLGRPELAVTFSKLLLWDQPYRQVLYLDCDVLPLANLDHLFEQLSTLESGQVAASPDAGWPDVFNSGVMMLQPNATVYSDLVKQAAEGVTFDGADQGLLNEYFAGAWHRLPFLYNVTPTESYQYAPAFHRFFSDIKILHYIGRIKPWHSRTEVDHFRFHHMWWDRFSGLYDADTSAHVLGTTGEAVNLQIPQYSNQWDATADAATTTAPEPAVPLAAVFPWELRQPPQATRVFESHWNRESERGPATQSKAPGNESAEGALAPAAKPAKSGLRKQYEFSSRNERSDFNPDESLNRVTQLPAQLMSKLKKDTSDK